MLPLFLLWFLFLGLPSHAAAESVVLSPVRDNTLFQDAEGDTSNGAGTGIFCGRNSQGRVRRALVAFDLTSVLPKNAQIDSASLVLRMSSSSDQSPRELRLHRVLADWGEGGSASGGGSGAPAQSGDATWLHTFYPVSLWSTPGGDHEPMPSASITVLDEGDYAWTADGLVNDLRGWLTQDVANFGWILMGDETMSNTARRFDSRESPTVEQRPRLVIYYSHSTPTQSSTWGRLKSLYR